MALYIVRFAAALTPLLSWVAFEAVAVEPGEAAVVADHPLASACGAEILQRGGNAADAAVATALCAGVVQPSASGLGGGGFAVVVRPGLHGGDVLDFREEAPSGASRDMYLDADGAVIPGLSRKGALSVAVPSESRGLAALLEAHGTLAPRAVARPAIRLARQGFRVGEHLARSLKREISDEVRAEFTVDGRVARAGDLLRRPALARTLQRWAATRGEDLHTGPGAQVIASHVQAAGGLLTEADLAAYQVRDRDPIVVRYRDYTVITMPPPSSGGLVLAQVLQVLEGYDLAEIPWGSVAWWHLITEAMKHAYADRARHMGDADVVDVPVEALLSEARVAEIRAAIDPDRTFPPEHYGTLFASPEDAGTQHISVWDGRGGAVALTTTVNTGFGSELVPPSLGVVLNDEMDDFSVAPGVPNAYGLVGSEANAIAPGKRPLSSMTPTVVLDAAGHPVLVVGASGGSTIISGTLQVLLAVLDHGMAPDLAVTAPRVHHQWQPDRLFVEGRIPPEVREGLAALGHPVQAWGGGTSVQAIGIDPEARTADGAADPRKGGAPVEVWRP